MGETFAKELLGHTQHEEDGVIAEPLGGIRETSICSHSSLEFFMLAERSADRR